MVLELLSCGDFEHLLRLGYLLLLLKSGWLLYWLRFWGIDYFFLRIDRVGIFLGLNGEMSRWSRTNWPLVECFVVELGIFDGKESVSKAGPFVGFHCFSFIHYTTLVTKFLFKPLCVVGIDDFRSQFLGPLVFISFDSLYVCNAFREIFVLLSRLFWFFMFDYKAIS